MSNIQINISDNGTTTLATAGKYCDRNVDVVVDVQGGGGGGDIPPEAFNITGNCDYRFASNGWNWFLDNYGNQITTENITSMASMFRDSDNIVSIPFTLNIADTGTYQSTEHMFRGCGKLTNIGTIKNLYPGSLNYLFYSCNNLRDLPIFEGINLDRIHSYAYANIGYMFYSCYSLRSIPTEFLRELYTAGTSTSYKLYQNGFYSCCSLDELIGLPVNEAVTITSNMFNNTFNLCSRLKAIVFDTGDEGISKTANWKSQTIDLAGTNGDRAVGVAAFTSSQILNYNSGITADKSVRTDEDYQALKNDADWFTYNPDYSRYNHDSAVETINSLPDTSAYLATSGGTNTIKFRGEAGSLTDGGAINTLTAEEIAVATAKGWTVTLV